jgi:hypothetical protein
VINPFFLFALFSLMAATGASLIALHFKGRLAAAVVGFLTLLFFVVLLWGVHELMRRGGVA